MKYTTAKIKVEIKRVGHVSLKEIFSSKQREDFQEILDDHARANEGLGNVLTAEEMDQIAEGHKKIPEHGFESTLDRLQTVVRHHKLDEIVFDD